MDRKAIRITMILAFTVVFVTVALWTVQESAPPHETAGVPPVEFCSATDGAQAERANAVNAALSKLPEGILENFEHTDWSIVVTSADLKDTFAEELPFTSSTCRIAGIADPATKRIFIADFAASRTVYHEVGHWFDLEHGNPSTTVKFTQAVAESNHFLLAIAVDPFPTSNQELFADLFAAYIERPNVLKIAAPGVYDYYRELITEMSRVL